MGKYYVDSCGSRHGFVSRDAAVAYARVMRREEDVPAVVGHVITRREREARDALVKAQLLELDAWDSFTAGGSVVELNDARRARDVVARAYRNVVRS
jgi:hypothetical protein